MKAETKVQKEIWKDAVGCFKDSYKVSNLGNVRSLDRKVKGGYNNFRPVKGQIIKQNIVNKYLSVALTVEGKGYNKRVHRLVASSFIPNPKNLPCINHKNEIKTDNRAVNLEWCTYKYNSNYRKPVRRAIGKKVYKYALNGDLITKYESLIEAAEQDNNLCANSISKCTRGVQKTHRGFVWRSELLSKNDFIRVLKGDI